MKNMLSFILPSEWDFDFTQQMSTQQNVGKNTIFFWRDISDNISQDFSQQNCAHSVCLPSDDFLVPHKDSIQK